MLSNKSRRILSLAACVGVALLLLSGNALAGITTGHSPLPTYAVQAGGPNIVYTVTPAGSFTRKVQATRNLYDAPNSSFLLRVDLQSGFVFANGGLPTKNDISASNVIGGPGINASGVEIYDGGQAGDSYVRYYIPTPAGNGVAFTEATLTVKPNPWYIKDVAGYLAGLHTAVKYMDVKATLFEVNGTQQFDSDKDESTDTAHMLKAANGIEAEVAREGKKVIDLENTRFFFEGWDETTDDESRLDLRPAPGVLGTNGSQFVFGTDINFTLTFTGNMTGIKNIKWGEHSCELTTTTGKIAIPGTNGCFDDDVRITINVTGTTPLDKRVLDVTVDYTVAHNSSLNDTALAATPLTEWCYNGSMLISSFSQANTNSWRTRYYIWNYDKEPSSILVRVLTLPIDGAIGSQALGLGQVVYRYTVAGNSGITIKLEDVLVDIGAQGPQLGPDGNGNMYAEFSFGSQRTVGWTSIFDPTGSTFMGMIQMHNGFAEHEFEEK